MTRTVSAALAILLLSAASPITAQDETAKGTIEGIVVSDASGSPVSGAQVTLGVFIGYSSTPLEPGFRRLVPATRGVPNAVTGSDGRFSIRNVTPGTHRLQVSADGYVPQEFGQKTAYSNGKPVYVSAGQTLKDVGFRLQSAGVISGRILNDAGQPAIGVPVELLHARYDALGRTLESAVMTNADDRGDYRLYGISPGRYYLAVGTPPESARPMVFVNPAQTPQQNYALQYYPGVSDISQAQMVDVKSGADITLDTKVKKQEEYRIRGRVIEAGANQPPGSVRISLLLKTSYGTASFSPSASYDAATGDFELRGVTPGSYTVQAETPGPPLPAPPDSRARASRPLGLAPVTVTNADINNVPLVMSRGIPIPAQLAVEGQAQIDLSYFSVRIALLPLRPGLPSSPAATPITSGGKFDLTNVRDGEYQVQVSGLVSGFFVKDIQYSGSDALNKPMSVSAANPGTLNITVRRGVGELSGSVTNALDQALAGVQVVLIPDQRHREDNYRLGFTGQDGQFDIYNIPPGSYKIFSWDPFEEGDYYNPDLVSRYEQQGRPVLIAEGSNANVSVKVIPVEP